MDWRRGRDDEDFAREIEAHLDAEAARLIDEGVAPDEARLAAQRAFGNVTRVRERFYDARRVRWADDAWRDLRHAARLLRRAPGFATVAILTLALGIGAATAIFSVIDAVLLRPLPYPHAERLVRLVDPPPGALAAGEPSAGGAPVAPVAPIAPIMPGVGLSELQTLRTRARSLSHIGIYGPSTMTMTGSGEAIRIDGARVSAAILPMVGARPLLGRLFDASEERAGADTVVLLAHATWQRLFQGDPSIVGRAIALDGRAHTVIGVLPRDFAFPDAATAFWTPFVLPTSGPALLARYAPIARVRSEVSLQAAAAEIDAILRASGATRGRLAPPPPPPPPQMARADASASASASTRMPPPPPPAGALPRAGLSSSSARLDAQTRAALVPPPPPPGASASASPRAALPGPPSPSVRAPSLVAPPPPPTGAAAGPRASRVAAPPRFRLVPLQDQIVAPVRPALLVLAGAVALVLLIACANVANLLLARSAARQREFAIRVALGGGGGRLARQLLTESALMAMLAAVAGAGLAVGGVRLLRALAGGLARRDLGPGVNLPRLEEIAIDPTALAFAIGLALCAGLLAGLAPALPFMRGGRGRRYSGASRVPLSRWPFSRSPFSPHPIFDAPREADDAGSRAEAQAMELLRDSTGSAIAGFDLFRRHRLRGLLIVSEIAMAMVLLVSGGLLLRSVVNLLRVDPGYDASNVITFKVARPTDDRQRTFAAALTDRLRALPGVRAAGYAQALPMVQHVGVTALRLTPDAPAGVPPPPGPFETPPPPDFPRIHRVSPDFLTVMGIRVTAGRGFSVADSAGAPRVVIVNRTLARSGLLGSQPIGRRIYLSDATPWEVIGVVDDVRQAGLDREAGAQLFVDVRQSPIASGAAGAGGSAEYYALRTDSADSAGSAHAAATPTLADLRDVIGAAVRTLDPRATLDSLATMEAIVAHSIARQRFYAALLALFAAAAVLLAAIGVFGIVACAVTQRTREIGVRMALGAARRDVLRLVLGQSVRLIAIGLLIGAGGAALATRLLAGLLFGLTPLDATTFAGAAALFAIVAIAAAWLPARRAARVDPLIALRAD